MQNSRIAIYIRLFSYIIFFSVFTSIHNPCIGITLKEALKKAYSENKEFETIQINFLHKIGANRAAWTAFLPSVHWQTSGSISAESNDWNDFAFWDQQTGKGISSRVILKQRIFNKGGNISKLQISKLKNKQYSWEYSITEQKIILELIKLYLEYLYSKEILGFTKDDLALYQNQLDSINEKYKHGEATILDVEVAKASLAKSRQDRHSAKANFNKTKLKFLLEFNFTPEAIKLPVLKIEKIENVKDAINNILKQNLDIKVASQEIHIAKASSAQAKRNIFLPTLDLSLLTKDFAPKSMLKKNKEGTIDLRNNAQISLVVNVPILNEGGRDWIEIKNSGRALALSKTSYQRKIQEIISSGKDTIENLNSLLAQTYESKYRLSASKMAYEGMNQEYKLGLKTFHDVLAEQEKLNNALKEDAKLRRDLIISFYMFKLLNGKLLMKEIDQHSEEYFDPNKHI